MGAGLLAKTTAHSTLMWQSERIREQARSHILICVQFRGGGHGFENYLRQIKNGKPKGFPFFVPRESQIT
ncbi:hypothetical protein EMIT0P218_140084 [Pseudomonas sp. IT-P218]